MSARIGIDLGGTKIEGVVLDQLGNVTVGRRIATPRDDYAAICAAIVGLVEYLETQIKQHAAVGIGMPGIVSPATGLVKNANTTCLIGRPLQDDLESQLGRELRLENDANCLILSEVNGGAADGAATAFGVIIGTGTGGGLYANGGLITGANAIAGEWGHNPVPWVVPSTSTRECYCGKANCVETFLSGAGLLRTYSECGGAGRHNVESIVAGAATGDTFAVMALATYVAQLAHSLATIVNIFDPAVIVLGGGVSNVPDLCARVGAVLAQAVFSDSVVTRLCTARFGDSSGVRGAANLWRVDGSLYL